jgi:cell division protein ZapA (FtsZ GTPase activity inhibitor)
LTFETDAKLVKVRVIGREYRIRSTSEEAVYEIASYLNDLFEHLKETSPALNQIDLTVMAAFKVASELFKTQDDLKHLKDRVEREVDYLSASIDRNLNRRLD